MRRHTKKEFTSIRWENAKVISEKLFEKGGGIEFRIGRWIVNNKPGPYQIERREFFETEDGRKYMKAKGLSYEDAKYIALNWEDIEHLFLGRRPLVELAVDSPPNGNKSEDF